MTKQPVGANIRFIQEEEVQRTIMWAILIMVVVALAGYGVFYAVRHHLASPPGTKKAPVEQPNRPALDECRLACQRLTICRNSLASADCPARCVDEWTVDEMRCIQQAACTEVDICFQKLENTTCAEACAKAETCGLFTPMVDCLQTCGSEWDEDFRRCLLDTPCPEVEATCLPALESSPCLGFCDQLAECGLLEQVDQAGCVEACLTVDDPTLRDCVARVTCDQIQPVCMADNFDPLCLDACDRLWRCDAMGNLDQSLCPALCQAEWDDGMLACLLERSCDELAPVCLQQPEPICEDICRKLIGCDLEDVYDDCTVTCSVNLESSLRSCILEMPCEAIDQICFGVNPDICNIACRKMAECQLDEDFDGCYQACMESGDPQLLECILTFPCESIMGNCIQ